LNINDFVLCSQIGIGAVGVIATDLQSDIYWRLADIR